MGSYWPTWLQLPEMWFHGLLFRLQYYWLPVRPSRECPDPCACLYSSTGLPAKFWESGQYASMPLISQYGAVCGAWDGMPGTPWYADYCAGKDYCTRANSWCTAAWCYV